MKTQDMLMELANLQDEKSQDVGATQIESMVAASQSASFRDMKQFSSSSSTTDDNSNNVPPRRAEKRVQQQPRAHLQTTNALRGALASQTQVEGGPAKKRKQVKLNDLASSQKNAIAPTPEDVLVVGPTPAVSSSTTTNRRTNTTTAEEGPPSVSTTQQPPASTTTTSQPTSRGPLRPAAPLKPNRLVAPPPLRRAEAPPTHEDEEDEELCLVPPQRVRSGGLSDDNLPKSVLEELATRVPNCAFNEYLFISDQDVPPPFRRFAAVVSALAKAAALRIFADGSV